VTSGEDAFKAALEFRAGQQDASTALEALKADVCPEAYDAPVVAAAGMGFAQPNDIVDKDVYGNHAPDREL